MSDSTVTTLEDNNDATKASASAPAPAAAPAGGKKTKAEAKAAGISDTLKTITIHNGEGAAGREDVFVGVNGYSYNIKRGKPVQVPVEVLEVLNNAVTTVYENGASIDQPRYAVSVH